MSPNATIVAIPIAIPIMESALLVLFLKGFFSINVMNLIVTTPFYIFLSTPYKLNISLNQFKIQEIYSIYTSKYEPITFN